MVYLVRVQGAGVGRDRYSVESDWVFGVCGIVGPLWEWLSETVFSPSCTFFLCEFLL